MLAEFLVAFREVFEIALIIGLIFGVLKKTKNERYLPLVYLGVLLAAAASVAAIWAFESLAGGFEAHEGIFEASTSILSALLVAGLAFFMLKGNGMKESIENGMQRKIDSAKMAGIAAFTFFNIFREGTEIILMMGSVWLSSGALDLAAAAAGAALAIALAIAVVRSMVKLDLAKFFRWTGVLLALFSAWLLIHGVSELFGIWHG